MQPLMSGAGVGVGGIENWKESIGDVVAVRVTPKASANRIVAEQQEDGDLVLKVYVTVVPEAGKANEAVIALLAKELGVAKSRITILQGETSRNKHIRIS